MGTSHAEAAEGSLTGVTPNGDILRVREVWDDNLDDEMKVRIEMGFICLRVVDRCF